MRAVGLITEYNPFHNGHLHHLQESLRLTGAEVSVAVMSGHFLQRGEPALVDKWARAEMALAAGVDLVLELPFPFACNSAPHFARGAVQTLNALGVVDTLSFGSEAGDIAPLQRLSQLLLDHSAEIEKGTRQLLKRGLSYPAARAELLARFAPEIPGELISSPNNILGIEYLRALQMTSSPIRAYTLPRLGAGYHSTELADGIASATGIRALLAQGGQVAPFLPAASAEIINTALATGRFCDPGRLFIMLQALLLQEGEGSQQIYQLEEGLKERFFAAALQATSYSALADGIKSRQWTLTRIQRVLSYLLLQVPSDQMKAFLNQGPMYLRLLGATENGRKLLARIRSKSVLPMISDPARAASVLGRFYRDQPSLLHLAKQMLRCDLRATRLYDLSLPAQPAGHRNRDFFQPVIHL